MTKNLHFGPLCSKDIITEVLWFIQMKMYKLSVSTCGVKIQLNLDVQKKTHTQVIDLQLIE